MEIEVGCKPSLRDQDDADRCAKVDESQERVSERQALNCKDNTPGSTSMVQRGFRVLVKQVLKENGNTARSKALQQALCRGMWQAKHLFQQHQLQAQPQKSMVVRWETFLPQQQLQVLLVEDDDATRHIVSALLRKCSYEVTSASNGLLAWQLLMDQTTPVDLVLAEVVMPFLSGIGLLGRIMSHESLKHIPVIMMSSHDSVNVVFKCLSKGAVDFLVKPVRKNELKNLWQHVWRRCHSSCGSMSDTGSQTQKTFRPNVATNLSESGTSGDSESTSGELNLRGGSDNGSGTQSRSNKGALEGEYSREANKPDLNGFSASLDSQPASKVEDNSLKAMHCGEKAKNPGAAANLVCSIKEQDSNQERQVNDDDDDLLGNHASSCLCSKDKPSDFNAAALDSSSILESPHKDKDHTPEKGGGGVIHSCVSVVSRYNDRENTKTSPANANVIETVRLRDGIPAKGADTGIDLESSAVLNFLKESIAFPPGGSDDATAKTLLKVDTEAECLLQYCPPGKCAVQISREFSSLPPVPCSFPPSKQAGISRAAYLGASPQAGESSKAKECFGSYKQDEFTHSDTNGYSQYHHHSHHHHHHHHIQHHYYHVAEEKLLTRLKTPQYDDHTVTDVGNGAPRCGFVNMVNGLSGSSNGYGSNCYGAVSVYGSATGSNNGSNGDQGAAVVLPIGGIKDVNEPVGRENSLPDSYRGMGPNENHVARQEATLNIFKLKRKERSFERKVGNQSRKRSTEQSSQFKVRR